MKEKPLVSIAVVAYNAAAFLPTLLPLIAEQTYPKERLELLLVDGRSTDPTRALMEAFARESGLTVRVLDNPARTLPAGCNVALRAYRGDLFLRLDAHAVIPRDFIEKNVEAISRGENIVGGFVGVVPPISGWAAVLSAVDASRFCGGAARFRNRGRAGYVDTLAFAMYRRAVYQRVGFYDERLRRTEDNDMVYRMKKAGYRFYYTPEIQSRRRPRSTLAGMLSQKWENGRWIAMTLCIQPRCFTPRHFVPVAFLLSLMVCLVLALFGLPQPLWVLLVVYGLCDLFFTGQAAAHLTRGKALALFTLPWLFPLVHLCYGMGTLVGLPKAYPLSREPMTGETGGPTPKP